jgi:predicted nucleic acid-binding protein
MLIDTSGLFCLLDQTTSSHATAVEIFEGASVRLLHNYILAELVALGHARRLSRTNTLTFVADLQDSPLVNMTWVTPTQHRAAMEFLQGRIDKTYSLCDAISFLLMREHRVTDALSTDRHFEQEGFTRLLAP